MCRFLAAKFEDATNVLPFLSSFSAMAAKSRTPDGDRQEDGWGVSYISNGLLCSYKSLKPIWDERSLFKQIPKTKMLLVHSRSAGFPSQIGDVSYNQPYVKNNIGFVFNGAISGVKIPISLDGKIGAQKIFSLAQRMLAEYPEDQLLERAYKYIKSHSQNMIGMNICVSMDDRLHALCSYTRDASYYTLHYRKTDKEVLVCSQPLDDSHWTAMRNGESKLF